MKKNYYFLCLFVLPALALQDEDYKGIFEGPPENYHGVPEEQDIGCSDIYGGNYFDQNGDLASLVLDYEAPEAHHEKPEEGNLVSSVLVLHGKKDYKSMVDEHFKRSLNITPWHEDLSFFCGEFEAFKCIMEVRNIIIGLVNQCNLFVDGPKNLFEDHELCMGQGLFLRTGGVLDFEPALITQFGIMPLVHFPLKVYTDDLMTIIQRRLTIKQILREKPFGMEGSGENFFEITHVDGNPFFYAVPLTSLELSQKRKIEALNGSRNSDKVRGMLQMYRDFGGIVDEIKNK